MKHYDLPDARGHFGPYGGSFVAETLFEALDQLRLTYLASRDDPQFAAEFARELKHFVGRPSPIYHARRWSQDLGGAQIYLKREDLNHTGAHKINNTIGQALLAHRMGKKRVIAETGAGQHGVATATVAARFGMSCVVYMGSEDMQAPGGQRLSDAPAGGRGARRRERLAHAQRRAQRGHARLGDQRRRHVLHHRHGGRAAPVSDDGARLQLRGGQGMPGADAGAGRAPARLRGRLRRRRQQRHGDLLRLSR